VGDGGVELLRGKDQTVSQVGGAVEDDRGGYAAGLRPEVGDQHAVVGQGRGDADATFGVDEARKLLDRGHSGVISIVSVPTVAWHHARMSAMSGQLHSKAPSPH
jgi:hypothetical protein